MTKEHWKGLDREAVGGFKGSTKYRGRIWEKTDDEKLIKYCPWVVLNVNGSFKFLSYTVIGKIT